MNVLIIFVWVISGFIGMAYWEAYIEGKHPWASKQVGWKKKISKRFTLTAYHFWLNVMLVFFLTLPLAINGWDTKLFGVILSAAAIGFVIEDIMWFVANPYFSLKKLNPKQANWYPWINIGIIKIPMLHVVGILLSIGSWYFLWG